MRVSQGNAIEEMMRKCFQCHCDLIEVFMEGEQVDRCPECLGIFFDEGELESICKIVELFQKVTMDEEDIDTISEAEKARQVICPADGTEMYNEEVGGLTIDICPVCKGIWLDGGEIMALKLAEKHIRKNIQLYVRLGS